MSSTSGPAVTSPPDNTNVSSDATHQEGIDYIKQQTFGTSTSTSSAGLGSVPASNPGADDPNPIASGHGGVSQTAGIDSPVPTETTSSTAQDQTLIGSIKSVLGFGGASTTTTTTESSIPSTEQVGSGAAHYGSVAVAGAAGLGASAAAGVASLTGSTYAADSAKSLDGTKQSYEQATGVSTGTDLSSSAPLAGSEAAGAYTETAPYDSGNAEPTATAAGPDNSATTVSSTTEPATTSTSDPTISAPTDPTTTKDNTRTIPEDPTTSTSRADLNEAETRIPSDKGTTDTTDADQAGAGPADKGEETKAPHAVGGQTGYVENPSAIPTAGGQRIGKAHEGESKVVPDIPEAPSESKEVVAENTAKNTGSATSGPGAVPGSDAHAASEGKPHGEKEKLTDKIKEKLHIGSHKS